MRERVEKYRHRVGQWGTNEGETHGLFFVPTKPGKPPLKIISSSFDEEWQHVSVSLPNRLPTWNEMSKVKDFFWDSNITVVQFHPKREEYINNHPHCLHLWAKRDSEFELPPSILVGIK